MTIQKAAAHFSLSSLGVGNGNFFHLGFSFTVAHPSTTVHKDATVHDTKVQQNNHVHHHTNGITALRFLGYLLNCLWYH